MKAMKTYGIHGLLEWHGTIHSKGLTMKLDFTNGSTTAYGVAPATFITKDEITQRIIENSDEFKSGRIKLVRKVELPDEEKKGSDKSASKTAADGTVVKEYPEVTGTQKAIEVLKEYGVDAALIKTKADAKRFAAEKNISFPNL